MSRFEIVLRLFLAIMVMALPEPILVSAAESDSVRRVIAEARPDSQLVMVLRSVPAPSDACASHRSKGPCPEISKLLVATIAAPDAVLPVLASYMETGFKPGPPPRSAPSAPRAPPQIDATIRRG